MIRSQINTLLKRFEKSYATHNRIEVSRAALLHNLELFRSMSGLRVIPVLKSNAYGHGIEPVVAALKGQKLPYVAVDGYFEALRIRRVSRQPVLIMGAIKVENFKKLKYDGFAFVVQDEASITALGRVDRLIRVHLEINTGMNRYGAAAADIESLVKLIQKHQNLVLEGVMSHLADSDGNDLATVDAAVKRFDAAVENIRQLGAKPKYIHLAQSAGSQAAKSQHANTMRLGVSLYGINPFAPGHRLHKKLKDLQPALKLISTITKVTELQKGDQVSYNYTFTAPRKMNIGVLPLGYYEGVNRALSNQGVVKIGNAYAPIVGRVCMNHTIIGLEGTAAKAGDEVIVISDNLKDKNSIDALASEYGLFDYNLLTALSPDVRRILVD